VWTVEKWLLHWLENIATPFVKKNTARGYRVAVTVHLIPGVGKHRLDKLEPEHLERLYVRMMRNGSSAGRHTRRTGRFARLSTRRSAPAHHVEPGQPREGPAARRGGGRAVHRRRGVAHPGGGR